MLAIRTDQGESVAFMRRRAGSPGIEPELHAYHLYV